MPIDLEKIGSFLKEKREDKGLTIYDVSNSLCLRRSLIEAIEHGDWTILPHEVYVRGYLREYAHLLNVDSDIGHVLSREETGSPQEPLTKPNPPVERRQFAKRAFVVPLTLILVGGLFILSKISKENPSGNSFAGRKIEASVRSGSGGAADSSRITAPVEAMEQKKLMITCRERTWISVVIDDSEKKEFMLNPQDIVVLNAKATYDLLIGNAAGVKLIFNGNDVPLEGESGEVKRINLS